MPITKWRRGRMGGKHQASPADESPDAPPRLAARFCAGLARHGADAGAEHDLSDLALDHAGPAAGIVSLGGVALGFVFYMLCAAFGITALLLAVPYAYDALRLSGAAYLLWLAWQAVKPNGRSPFQVRELAVDGPRKLFAMGFVTNLLNPKIAMLYLALLPQFIDPAAGSVLMQSLALGSIQIVISVSVNAAIALAAGSIALFLGSRPSWLKVQRWLMGTVLAGLAVRMALETRRA
jgi:threonine/homoserine/homoserine lactone efflux protein